MLLNPNSALIGLGIFLVLWFTDVGMIVFGVLRGVSDLWVRIVQGIVLRLTEADRGSFGAVGRAGSFDPSGVW